MGDGCDDEVIKVIRLDAVNELMFESISRRFDVVEISARFYWSVVYANLEEYAKGADVFERGHSPAVLAGHRLQCGFAICLYLYIYTCNMYMVTCVYPIAVYIYVWSVNDMCVHIYMHRDIYTHMYKCTHT